MEEETKEKFISEEEERIIVVGGGVIGASICYYLTENGVKNILLIERSALACHASGKAGGFLARDWGNSKTSSLHSLSFDLLEQLAQKLDIKSYRKITTLSVEEKKGKNVATWLDGSKVSSKVMDKNTAQINPAELTNAFFTAAQSKGNVEYLHATVTGLSLLHNSVTAVKVREGNNNNNNNNEEREIKCGKCVIAMGVWSTLVGDWIGNSKAVPMQGIRSTSLIFKQGMEKIATDEPFVLFCGENKHDCHLEVYPRKDEVYLCGCGGSDYIEGDRLREGGDCEKAEDIKANEKRVKAATMSFEELTDVAKGKEADVIQACMRPCPPDALPLIGKISSVRHLYIAAGHNCWGILWSAATGLLISQLISHQPLSIPLSPFDPNRFISPRPPPPSW